MSKNEWKWVKMSFVEWVKMSENEWKWVSEANEFETNFTNETKTNFSRIWNEFYEWNKNEWSFAKWMNNWATLWGEAVKNWGEGDGSIY